MRRKERLENFVSINYLILRGNPFSLDQTRKKGKYFMERFINKDKKEKIGIRNETEEVNIYDLVTLLYIIREFQTRKDEIETIQTEREIDLSGFSEGDLIEIRALGHDKEIVKSYKLPVYLNTLSLIRNDNNKKNRINILESIKRLKNTYFTFKDKEYKIFEDLETDGKFQTVYITITEETFNFLTQKAILLDLNGINKLGKDYYAIAMYIYLTATKQKEIKRHKVNHTILNIYYRYRHYYSQNEIEYALKLDQTKYDQYKKNKIIKKTLKKISEKFNISYGWNIFLQKFQLKTQLKMT